MLHSERLAILARTLYLARIVVGSIVEGHCQSDARPIIMKKCDGVHPSRKHYDRIFFHFRNFKIPTAYL